MTVRTRLLPLLCPLLLWTVPHAARAGPESGLVGLYRAAEGPDVASHLLIGADGRFRYELMAGALDQWAQGDWRALPDGGIALTTRPQPKAPQFRVENMTGGKGKDAPFSLMVVWPNGRGAPGVDFRIGLGDGSVTEGYTQEDGWRADLPAEAQPVWIELQEPIYGTTLARTPIPQGARELRFVLEPNDMGVVDFRDARAELRDGRLILHMPGGDIGYVRVEQERTGDGSSSDSPDPANR